MLRPALLPSISVAPATPTPHIPLESHPVPSQPTGPVHPYTSACDVICSRPGVAHLYILRADPIPESASKGRDSIYKIYILVYNLKVADDVFTRSLATSSITLTPGELFTLASKVHSKY